MKSVYEKYEKFFVRWTADVILCVSSAMRNDLIENWNVKCDPVVVYDRPNSNRFKELKISEKHEFFNKYLEFWDSKGENRNDFSRYSNTLEKEKKGHLGKKGLNKLITQENLGLRGDEKEQSFRDKHAQIYTRKVEFVFAD